MAIDRRKHLCCRRELAGLNRVDKKRLALNVLNRSRVIALRATHTTASGRRYCTFYNRFGRCNRAESCPYRHDQSKVAVCRRFLRGTCPLTGCLFSHVVAKDKMPVCSFYLRGLCTKDDCPYLHVNVNKDAAVCREFLAGYCALGEKCGKKHTLVCQQFVTTGKCQNEEKCKLKHPRKRKRVPSTKKPKQISERGTGVFVPSGSMPSFIGLDPDPPAQTPYKENRPLKEKTTTGLQIRPNFGDF